MKAYKYTFAPSSMTLAIEGSSCPPQTFPVEYVAMSDGIIRIFVTMDADDADKDVMIDVAPDGECYADVLAAANAAQTDDAPTDAPQEPAQAAESTTEAEETPDAPQPSPTAPRRRIKGARTMRLRKDAEETVDAQPVQIAAASVETIDDATVEAVEPADADVPAAPPEESLPKGYVPDKSFVGSTIVGKGFRIFFNPEVERTQVTVEDPENAAMIEAVTSAGFYYSPKSKTYNKKLTMRAYRAAMALAARLNAA